VSSPAWPKSLLLIGYGKMGSALAEGWSRAGFPNEALTVVTPSGTAAPGVACFNSLDALPKGFAPDCVLLAVKPQQMGELLPFLKGSFGNPLYISIAAGKSFPYYTHVLGEVPFIRAMPNTPSLIGKGMTGLVGNSFIQDRHRTIADSLFKAAGEVMWVSDEGTLDALAAISGCGPAYLFYFLECWIEAAKDLGFSEVQAKSLVMQTAQGSFQLADKSIESLVQLRQNVTSKGGMTEAALNKLMTTSGLKELMHDGVRAALERAKNLA